VIKIASGIEIGEIMKKAVITAKPTDTVEKIIKVMDKTGVGGLIIEENEEVKGIITEGDIISEIAEDKDCLSKEISEIMKHPVKVINRRTDLEKAIKIMRDMDIERLPIVEEGRLVGIVTERDLIKVEPALMEMAREKRVMDAIRSNKRQEVRAAGNCELCEIYSNELKHFEGKLMCTECIEEKR